MEQGEQGERCNIKRGDGGGRGETRPAEGDVMGHARKLGERATGGCKGRREQRQERHLRDGLWRGDAGPPWGMERAREKKEAEGDGREHNPGEWGEILGAGRPPEWTLIPTEWKGRRGAARPPEWRKTLGGAAKEWGGSRIFSGQLDPPRRGRGGRVVPGQLDPQRRGRGS